MTEYTIGQVVRLKPYFHGTGGALRPIADEVPDWLAAAIHDGAPMTVTAEGYEHDQQEDIDVVIVRVQLRGRKPFEQWVHPEAIAPV